MEKAGEDVRMNLEFLLFDRPTHAVHKTLRIQGRHIGAEDVDEGFADNLGVLGTISRKLVVDEAQLT